jgi:hypothetical protein
MSICKVSPAHLPLFFYVIFFTACHSGFAPQSGIAAKSVMTHAPTDPVNKEIRDEKGNPDLLGLCTRAGLEKAPYNSWFIKNYDDYAIDSATANQLKLTFSGKRFKIFMGTWCGDSRREVPRFYKILDYCGIDASAVQLIMVSDGDSTYKQSPGHEERGLDIIRVPDLIVMEDGKELGRVIESPVVSLEKDLLLLSAKEGYTPKYAGANRLVLLFREEKPETMEKQLPGLAARIRPLVRSSAELNGYARVMRTAGETKKADIILKINALIFPQ